MCYIKLFLMELYTCKLKTRMENEVSIICPSISGKEVFERWGTLSITTTRMIRLIRNSNAKSMEQSIRPFQTMHRSSKTKRDFDDFPYSRAPPLPISPKQFNPQFERQKGKRPSFLIKLRTFHRRRLICHLINTYANRRHQAMQICKGWRRA